MRPFHRNISITTLLVGLSIVGILALSQNREAASFIGGTIAVLLDLRFLLFLGLAAFLINRLNTLWLAIIVTAADQIYLNLTMQEYWNELGIRPNLLSDAAKPFFASLMALSLVHILVSRNTGSNREEAQ